MMAQATRSVGKLNPRTTTLLVCDMQERFRPLIWRMETVIETTKYMTSVAKLFDVPTVATVQYSKAFGDTIVDCFADRNDLKTIPIFEKKKFSMLTDDCKAKLDELGRDHYLIVGIEAHVCVQQTCLDLLEAGKQVHVIADAVSSQTPYDREMALKRLEKAGCFLTTAQSVAFMLAGTADNPLFKQMSKLTIDYMNIPNAFNNDYKDYQVDHDKNHQLDKLGQK